MIKKFEGYDVDSGKGVVDESLLTIEEKGVKLWHYSNVDIKDSHIKPGLTQQMHSRSEFKAWGKSRAFFYTHPGGYKGDSIVMNHKFTYICHIPYAEIYDKSLNKDGFEPNEGNHLLNSYYDFTKYGGYTAWSYNLYGDVNNPIVVSFIPVEISESYTTSEGGLKIERDEVIDDYKIGTITYKELGDRAEKKWDIYQNGGYLKTLTNTYLKSGGERKNGFGGSTYLHDKVELLPEFKGDYV